MTQYGLHPIAMFELTPVGIPFALVGLACMAAVGWRLIPDRTRTADLTAEFDLRPYLTELVVLPDSPLVGKTLAEAGLGHDLDVTAIWLSRESGRRFSPRATTRLQTGDVLLVEAERDEILKIKDRAGIEIKAHLLVADGCAIVVRALSCGGLAVIALPWFELLLYLLTPRCSRCLRRGVSSGIFYLDFACAWFASNPCGLQGTGDPIIRGVACRRQAGHSRPEPVS